MEQKVKVLFNLFNTFLLKTGCEEMSVELGDTFDLWNGNKFYCNRRGRTETIPFPIPIGREISEYVQQSVESEDSYYSDNGEEFYTFEFTLYPKERLIEVTGVYIVYGTEDFTEEVIEAEEEPDVFDEIFEYLEDSGSDILEVNVNAGGDSGWIEDTAYDVNGKKIDVTQEMQDVGYRLLSNHPGWEINAGSTSSFTWDRHRRILIFKFAYNTEEQATELISKESF
jgi:hypothetical protein